VVGSSEMRAWTGGFRTCINTKALTTTPPMTSTSTSTAHPLGWSRPSSRTQAIHSGRSRRRPTTPSGPRWWRWRLRNDWCGCDASGWRETSRGQTGTRSALFRSPARDDVDPLREGDDQGRLGSHCCGMNQQR
jgi:hypothetical protein